MEKIKPKRHREAQKNYAIGKEKMKSYADKRRHAIISDIKVGDTVFLKEDKKNKNSVNFDSITFRVLYGEGGVTAER